MNLDKQTVLRFLKSLGYTDGDRLYLRFFYPSEDPRKKSDKGRAATATYPHLPWKQIEGYQNEGRGVYVVVNGSGQKDDAVTHGRAIFYEHDTLEKDLQRDLWQSLGLPAPTLQVDTGGKSIHSYWVFETPIPVEDWRELQADLLEMADADRTIKNPSRVMRLAGCFHLSPDRTPPAIQSRIVSESGARYSFNVLRTRVPRRPHPSQSRWTAFERSFTLPISDSVPLSLCLSKASRDLVENGAPEGNRNRGGAALARDLMGTAVYLDTIGQRYEGTPTQLFDQFCDRCGPPITASERRSIWKSAEKGRPGPSLAPEQIEGCIKGWSWREQREGIPPSQTARPSPSNPSSPVAPSQNLATHRTDVSHGATREAGQIPRLAIQYRAVEAVLGKHLRLNELTNQIELRGDPVEDVTDLRLTLAIEQHLSVSIADCETIVKRIAKENSYHPVEQYLTACRQHHGEATGILEDLAIRFFGCTEPIYNIYLKKTLVAAVARVLDPGCKVDTALILNGRQGLKKSGFFRVLAGAEWFDDSMGAATSERDERLKLHQFWVLEWGELEGVFKRKDLPALKALLTCCVDTVRPPYGRNAVSLKRRSIIVGSTNQDEFLTDATGNRRFWVVPVKQSIDLERLAAERDHIWAAAVALYQSGYQWWLTAEEEAISAELNEAYRTEDPWLVAISSYLKDNARQQVTTAELLTHALRIECGRQKKPDQMRATEVLRSLGWKHERHTVAGKRRWVWVKPDEDDRPPSEIAQEPETSLSPEIQSPVSSGQADRPDQLSIQRLSIPETPTYITVQNPDPTWTTPDPKKETVPRIGHDPTPNIQPLSDLELANLMTTGGEAHG